MATPVGHAAQPDRHRHARAHRARPDHVLPLDGARACRSSCCCSCSWPCSSRRTCARGLRVGGGQQRAGARRAPAARAGVRRPSATCSSRSASTVVLWVAPGLFAIGGWERLSVRAGVREGDARRRRRDGRRDAAVRAARSTGGAAVHADVGSGGADRLGHRAALRRRAGDGRSGVLDRPGRRAGARRSRAWLPSHTDAGADGRSSPAPPSCCRRRRRTRRRRT